MKLAVNKAKLLAAMEAQVEELKKRSKKADTTEADLKAWKEQNAKKMQEAYEKALKRLNRLTLTTAVDAAEYGYDDAAFLSFNVTLPKRCNSDEYGQQAAKHQIERISKAIKKLGLTDAETLELDENDRYLEYL